MVDASVRHSRILVVDDVPAVRLILRNALEQGGYANVLEADDGEAAWRMIQASADDPQKAIELVIADWNMAVLSGIDLLRAVRAWVVTRQLPFLLITAETTEVNLREAATAGVTDFVPKPFDGRVLLEKIEAALKLNKRE